MLLSVRVSYRGEQSQRHILSEYSFDSNDLEKRNYELTWVERVTKWRICRFSSDAKRY